MLIQREEAGQNGSVLLAAICLLVTLGALGAAHFAVVQSSFKQSKYFALQSYLHQYAQSGVALAIHDFDNYVTDSAGNIGTTEWSTSDDVGADGAADTLDEGEADGIPTPGEPNLAPADIGPADLGIKLLVSVYPTPYVGVFRIVSTCFNEESQFTTQRAYRNTLAKFTLPSTIYVNPDIQVSFGEDPGTSIRIDSADQSDKSPKGKETLLAMATSAGETPGDNLFALLCQVPATEGVQLVDGSGTPSIGEIEGVNFAEVFDSFRGKATVHLQPGDYSDLSLGCLTDSESLEVQDTTLMGSEVNTSKLTKMSTKVEDGKITEEAAESRMGLSQVYVDGDLMLRGNAGRALIIVNGALNIVGPCQFEGILIVRGDVKLQGEGDGITIQGGLMVDGASLEMTGKVNIVYNSGVLEHLTERVRSYVPLYYTED